MGEREPSRESTFLDVTDLVEFLQRRESVSGVQRVIAQTVPLLLALGTPVVLDRGRGVFVAMTAAEQDLLIVQGARSTSTASRDDLAHGANACLARAGAAEPIAIDAGTMLVFLGAVWISDALMMAARDAHTRGARMVYLLYDLTPVLEAGHTAAVNRLFQRYLALVLDTASAVPAISASSRRDLATYAQARGWQVPSGTVTGLPCGITADEHPDTGSPWPRPYALFVGTVEARKRHLLALRTWQALIAERGADAVPDLVCIGRLGWHASEFLDEYLATDGLAGKVSLLATSVTDEELSAFYRHAEFTFYPSRYEGWGLPVSESLAFGRLPVVSRTSSIPEAGGDLAAYVDGDDPAQYARVVAEVALDEAERHRREQRIAAEFVDRDWQQVADAIAADVALARAQEGRDPVYAQVDLGREYCLSQPGAAPDAGYADQYLRHLRTEQRSPMLGQPRRADDATVVDRAIVGTFGSPQTWGYEVRPGRHADIRIARPVDGPLIALLATRSQPGVVHVQVSGPGGPMLEEVYLGSVVTVPLGDGRTGEPARARIAVTDASDSIEGFLGLRSFVILRADDLQAQLLAAQSAAAALRQELDFIRGTRSWKVTAPLRRLAGRGS